MQTGIYFRVKSEFVQDYFTLRDEHVRKITLIKLELILTTSWKNVKLKKNLNAYVKTYSVFL